VVESAGCPNESWNLVDSLTFRAFRLCRGLAIRSILVRPQRVDPTMTPLQSRTLRIWLKFRHRPMSIGALFWASRRTYLLMFLGFAVPGWLTCGRFGWSGVAFLLVAFVTALLRDLGYFIRSARAWPIIREALDWDKVEALLAAEEAATPTA
jgi:hypothetical protein